MVTRSYEFCFLFLQVFSISVPFLFKWAVDNLNEASGDTLNLKDGPTAIISLSTALLLACKFL